VRPKKYYASFSVRRCPDWIPLAISTTNSAWWRGHRAGTLLMTNFRMRQPIDGRFLIEVEFTKRASHEVVVIEHATNTCSGMVSFRVYRESRYQDIIPSRVKLRSRKPSASRR
jgi:hypothetical protein